MCKGEPDKRKKHSHRYEKKKKKRNRDAQALSRWQRTQTMGKECCRYVSIMIVSFPAKISILSGATAIQ